MSALNLSLTKSCIRINWYCLYSFVGIEKHRECVLIKSTAVQRCQVYSRASSSRDIIINVILAHHLDIRPHHRSCCELPRSQPQHPRHMSPDAGHRPPRLRSKWSRWHDRALYRRSSRSRPGTALTPRSASSSRQPSMETSTLYSAACRDRNQLMLTVLTSSVDPLYR